MKYILWPIVAIIIVITRLAINTIYGITLAIWHLRIPTVRDVYTVDGHYLFKNWNWKHFLREIIDYDYCMKSEE